MRKGASERKHSNIFEFVSLAEQMKQEAMENCHAVIHYTLKQAMQIS